MNRAERRAAKHRKPVQKPRFRHLHAVLLQADGIPRIDDDPDQVISQKLVMLNGIAALKDGTFGYDQATAFHDFVSLALRASKLPIGKPLEEPACLCAQVMTAIFERWQNIGRFTATGDELRVLSEWVEAIADAMAEFPVAVIRALLAEHAMMEVQMRQEIAAKLGDKRK
jgi:hypothetical protein